MQSYIYCIMNKNIDDEITSCKLPPLFSKYQSHKLSRYITQDEIQQVLNDKIQKNLDVWKKNLIPQPKKIILSKYIDERTRLQELESIILDTKDSLSDSSIIKNSSYRPTTSINLLVTDNSGKSGSGFFGHRGSIYNFFTSKFRNSNSNNVISTTPTSAMKRNSERGSVYSNRSDISK